MRKIKFLSVFVLLALLLSAVPPTMAQKPPHWSDPAVVHSLDEPPVEQVPPDIPPEDANWPIIEQWTRTEVDARGGAHTITYTIRQNPAPIELQATEAGCKLSEGSSPAGPVATSATCTYLGTFSQSASHTIQGITQRLKSYYYKYRWQDGGGQTYAAYRTYKTEEWWTRTSTQYGLADNDTDWNYYGWDCDNHWQVKDAQGSFWPQWYNNTETYHYIYDFTKNWPILTPGAYVGAGILRTRETTPAYKGGYIGTLVTEIRYRNW